MSIKKEKSRNLMKDWEEVLSGLWPRIIYEGDYTCRVTGGPLRDRTILDRRTDTFIMDVC